MKLKLSRKELFFIYIALARYGDTGMWDDHLSKKERKALRKGSDSFLKRFKDLKKKDYLINKEDLMSNKERAEAEKRKDEKLKSQLTFSHDDFIIAKLKQYVKMKSDKYPSHPIKLLYDDETFIGVEYLSQVIINPTNFEDMINFIIEVEENQVVV